MTDRARFILHWYIVIVATALAIILSHHNSMESRALRLDLKVMTLEIKGETDTIIPMGKLRNETRAKAEKLQRSALFLAIALATISPALGATSGVRVLVGVSFIAAGVGSVFVGMALL